MIMEKEKEEKKETEEEKKERYKRMEMYYELGKALNKKE